MGTGMPLAIVNLPNQLPIALKEANFLSLLLLSVRLNQACKILYVIFRAGFYNLGILSTNL
jgi:hypothetical protein